MHYWRDESKVYADLKLRRTRARLGSVVAFWAVFNLVPKEMFFTKGVGKHREKLTSFELALRSAGIAACNLVACLEHLPARLPHHVA